MPEIGQRLPMPELTFISWRGGSGEIRGRQVAEFLGANSEIVFDREQLPGLALKHQGTKVIFVKGQPPENYPPDSYLDMMDAKERFEWIDRHPEIKLIGISRTAIKAMERRLGRVDIHFIPEHHCNWENIKRDRTEITRCGVIGNNNAFWQFNEDIADAFADLGLEFHYQTQ